MLEIEDMIGETPLSSVPLTTPSSWSRTLHWLYLASTAVLKDPEPQRCKETVKCGIQESDIQKNGTNLGCVYLTDHPLL